MAGSNRNMTIRRSARLVPMVMMSGLIFGCGEVSVADACLQGSLFTNARARVERAVSEFDRTTRLEVEDAVVAMVDQVSVLREVAPRALRDPLGVLLAAYGQLTVAFDEVGWDPLAAANDADVNAARAAFAEESVVGALDEVQEFLVDQCEQARGAVNPDFALTGTTLPNPVVSEEPSRDANDDPVVSDDELRSLGFAIGESYGVALTDEEAKCVARELGVNFVGGSDVDIDDEEFFGFVRSAFVTCAVVTPPTTAPNN